MNECYPLVSCRTRSLGHDPVLLRQVALPKASVIVALSDRPSTRRETRALNRQWDGQEYSQNHAKFELIPRETIVATDT
jgi:hypothetical protein